MIDDSVRKIGKLTANLIEIPEFDVTENPFAPQSDQTLERISEYLEELCTSNQPIDDVRSYMAKNPFA